MKTTQGAVSRYSSIVLCCLAVWFGQSQITISAQNLPAPSLSAPSNGAANVSTTPTFSWSAVTGASAGYVIAVATSSSALPTDPTASTCSGCVIIASGTSHTPSSGLSAGTPYFWRVRGRGPGAIYGNWSGTFSFTTAPTLSSIQISSGPAQVNENSSAQYTCTATYSDATTANVTSSATWSIKRKFH